MFCKNCGQNLDDNAAFCPVCGTPTPDKNAAPQPGYSQPGYSQPGYSQPGYSQPGYSQPGYPQPGPAVNYSAPVSAPPAGPVLTFGILGIAFACTFFLSFLGIVFGAITGGKVKGYLAAGGELTGPAKVGKILGKVGLIVGIVMTVLFFFYIVGLASLL